LEAGGRSQVFNCGYGHGFSVRQVLETVQRVSGRSLTVRSGPRRAGDPPNLFADIARIREVLDWRPAHDDLSEIVASALAWEKRLKDRALTEPSSSQA
ncbi:MAG: UDP-glucose 4-epimerase GalE, partial [Kiloniellales bacterium]|nr:UDP-glucose 4-epimerase GalE [Kiloniellales bacterium]